MKKAMILAVVMFFGACSLTGCSRSAKVLVTTAEQPDVPYEPLGQIQIEHTVSGWGISSMWHSLEEFIIYNRMSRSSQSEYLQYILQEKLRARAKKNYGADAVVRVQYWPDLDSAKFPKGKVYAKGEMVRYKRFPN